MYGVADRDFSNGQNFTAPHFGNEFSVEASQVVFAGGAIHNNIKVLEIQKQISEWNLAEQRQQVYFLLAGYYLDLYKYRNLLVVYDRNMEQTMEVIGNMPCTPRPLVWPLTTILRATRCNIRI